VPAAFGTRIIIRDHHTATGGRLSREVARFEDGAERAGYNRGVRPTGLAIAALMLAACSSPNIDNKEAIRLAMVEYLMSNQSKTGLDPNAMDVRVDAALFEPDVARATVSFTIKGTDSGMQMNYTLDRARGKWINPRRQDSTAAPHGLPGPDGGAGPDPSTPLPAGHPSVPNSSK
jgi:hypothetical protein